MCASICLLQTHKLYFKDLGTVAVVRITLIFELVGVQDTYIYTHIISAQQCQYSSLNGNAEAVQELFYAGLYTFICLKQLVQ